MKNAVAILAVVIGYSLLETGLLLSTITYSQPYFSPTNYQRTIFFGQLLLLPGLAAILSRIQYGSYDWPRRTLSILLAGSLGVPLILIIAATPFAILAYIFDTSSWLLDGLVPVMLLSLLAGLFVAVRKSGKWSVRAEAERWLAERHSGIGRRERKWRSRGIRGAVCIPSMIVLLLLLFLPETWGILSHLSHPQPGKLDGIQIAIPATWIVLSRADEMANGRTYATGLGGHGFAREAGPYLRREPPLFSWNIGTAAYGQTADAYLYRERQEKDEVIDRRVVSHGMMTITCLDYGPFSPPYRPPSHRPQRPEDVPWADIQCSDGARFYATFSGARNQVRAFYGMLERITPAK